MWRGLLAGAFWGGLVGVLVLVVAALTLEGRKGADAPQAATDFPAVNVPLPRSPDTAPPLPGAHAKLADQAADDVAVSHLTRPDLRGLLPRPGKPALPDLIAADPPTKMAEAPPELPEPALPAQLPAGLEVAASIPTLAPPPAQHGGAAALGAPKDPAALRPPPGKPGTALATSLPAQPNAPGPLIAAVATPQGSQPPAESGLPEGIVPNLELVPRANLPEHPVEVGITARLPIPHQAASARILASPLRAGPRIAFILTTDTALGRPVPDWIMTDHGSGVAPFQAVLWTEATPETDLPQVFAVGSGRAFAEVRAGGRHDALLAYARLDSAADATQQILRRIAARARRDGDVSVLVGSDPALWAVLENWLGDQAQDLVPMPAAALLP
ncbi:hypothetical protein G5B39_12125 [Rhodobacteraceae bacterium SC52]|nr:hypothetical protein G5B39_12125 [Rhodobacteraceae bacterium SC52]